MCSQAIDEKSVPTRRNTIACTYRSNATTGWRRYEMKSVSKSCSCWKFAFESLDSKLSEFSEFIAETGDA